MSADKSSPIKSKWVLNQESFDRLLMWLNPDREAAGRRYEDIRFRLIKIFMHRGCPVAEELADETINRVARKVAEIESDYVGDHALYFYGVANNVFLEHVKKRPGPLPLPDPDPPDEKEKNYRCLEKCLEHLTPQNRKIIVGYYTHEKKAKIENRKALADSLGISINTLRMRAHRLKAGLQDCVFDCIDRIKA